MRRLVQRGQAERRREVVRFDRAPKRGRCGLGLREHGLELGDGFLLPRAPEQAASEAETGLRPLAGLGEMRERLEQVLDRPGAPMRPSAAARASRISVRTGRRGLLEGTAQVRDGAFGGAFRERAVGCGPEQADDVRPPPGGASRS